MKNSPTSGSLILIIFFLFVPAALAQSEMQPPPENIKVALQPDSPVQITIDQMRVHPKHGRSMSYSVRNTASKSVRGFVVHGMPGSGQRAVFMETPLLPGVVRGFGILVLPKEEITGDFVAKIDFVLYEDGSEWGTRATGDADYVVNFLDGLKRVIADSKILVAEGDDAKLTQFINSPPNFPENGSDITKWTRKQEGFMRGYGVGLMSFRESVRVRGDLKGIPGRLADLERGLGNSSPATESRKRVTMSHGWFEPPIKILDVSIGKDPVSLEESFPSRPDWLKGLRFKIKNTSGKTINRVSIDLDFPETVALGDRVSWPLSYGPVPVPSSAPNKRENETPLAPDALLDLTLTDAQFETLKKSLSLRQGLDAITRVNIVIETIHFDDGTAWMQGQVMKQDPDDPRRWIPIK
jgi:hypothetical protein